MQGRIALVLNERLMKLALVVDYIYKVKNNTALTSLQAN